MKEDGDKTDGERWTPQSNWPPPDLVLIEDAYEERYPFIRSAYTRVGQTQTVAPLIYFLPMCAISRRTWREA
ncbi:unnamed protein product [Ectocarpus sp. 13 AM-2016]